VISLDTFFVSKFMAHTTKKSAVPLSSTPTGSVRKSTSLVSSIRDIDWRLYRPNRAGAIPFFIVDKTIFFCLGEDATFKQFTDFGGGVMSTETSLEGGIRELQEESLEIFGPINYDDVQDCLIVTSRNMMIFFLPVNLPLSTYVKMFNIKKETERSLEVTNIFWFTQHQLQALIKGYDSRMRLFYKVRNILDPVFTDIVTELLKRK